MCVLPVLNHCAPENGRKMDLKGKTKLRVGGHTITQSVFIISSFAVLTDACEKDDGKEHLEHLLCTEAFRGSGTCCCLRSGHSQALTSHLFSVSMLS